MKIKKRQSLTKEILFGGPINENDPERKLKRIFIGAIVFGILTLIFYVTNNTTLAIVTLIASGIPIIAALFQYKLIKKGRVNQSTKISAWIMILLGGALAIGTITNQIINGWWAAPHGILNVALGILFFIAGLKVLKKL